MCRDTWEKVHDFLVNKRIAMLIVATVITGITLSQFPALKVDDSPTAFLPQDIKEVTFWQDLNSRFGALNNLMIGLEEPSLPLTSEGLTRVATITKRIEEMKKDGVLSAKSVINIDATEIDEEGTLNVDNLVPAVPTTQEGLDALASKIQGNTQVPGAFISHDMKAYVVMVKLADGADSADLAARIISIVEEERGPLSSYYFGSAFAIYQVSKRIIDALRWVVPVFAIALFVVLFIGLRRPAAFLLTLLCAALPLAWWLGTLKILGIPVTMPVLNGSLLLLTLGALVFARVAEGRTRGLQTFFPIKSIAMFLVAAIGFAVVTAWLNYVNVSIPFLNGFSLAVAIGFVVLAVSSVLFIIPIMTLLKPAPELTTPVPSRQNARGAVRAFAMLCAVGVIGLSLFSISNFKFAVSLEDMFSPKEDVGKGVDFFDRKLGGNEILQVSVKGDFSKAAPLNRLMRFTDIIEGSGQFADVRSITQVLAYLASGMTGTYWIPPTDGQVRDIMFFIAGIEEVKSLITHDRDEAMLAIRVPANSKNKNAELIKVVEDAVASSAEIGPQAARLRLKAISNRYNVRLPEGRIDQVVSAGSARAGQVNNEAVIKSVKDWIDSEESPWNPTPEEWTAVAVGLGRNAAEIASIIKTQPSWTALEYPDDMATKLAESMLVRALNVKIEDGSNTLTDMLVAGVDAPQTFKMRARGILSSLLAGEPDGSEQLEVTISGYPAFTKVSEDRLMTGLKMAALLLFMVAAIYVMFTGLRNPSRLFVLPAGAAATLATFALSGVFGINADPNSASIYLIAPLAWLFLSDYLNDESGSTSRYPMFFACALSAGAASLYLFGVMPIIRIGSALALSLMVTVVVITLAHRLWYKQQD